MSADSERDLEQVFDEDDPSRSDMSPAWARRRTPNSRRKPRARRTRPNDQARRGMHQRRTKRVNW